MLPAVLTTGLTSTDLDQLVAFRHHLHQHPEISGEEVWTAQQIQEALAPLSPSLVLTGLGGHGVAAVFDSGVAGPTVMFRSEIDALPIADESGTPWASRVAGKGHQCGHDGHSTILLGLARLLSRQGPATGRVVLLFQPAEEDGSGAAAVIADPRFAPIKPDWAFSLHNHPGYPLGAMAIEEGPANCASRGLKVVLRGHTSHAATPHLAKSPVKAIARLIEPVIAAKRGERIEPGFRLVTVTHVAMGEPAFGITPGEGQLWLTLRTLEDADMASLVAQIEGLARAEAEAGGFELEITQHDVFFACTNQAQATQILQQAAGDIGVALVDAGGPMRASEDFGLFGSRAGAKAAMFRFGSGVDAPNLHNPDYDFPDALIGPGIGVFDRVVRRLLG